MGVGRRPAITQASWRPPSGEAPARCKGFMEASGSSLGSQHLRILHPQNVFQAYPSISPSLSATWGDCAPQHSTLKTQIGLATRLLRSFQMKVKALIRVCRPCVFGPAGLAPSLPAVPHVTTAQAYRPLTILFCSECY